MSRATGRFEVSIHPQAVHEAASTSGIDRLALDKRYRGALDATGVGEMLAARTATAGSAGYVAIEKVDGTLDGRHGSFVLQHAGTMTRDVPTLLVTVVPDSGAGGLLGLAGTLAIRIEDGVHHYDFEYTLRPDG